MRPSIISGDPETQTEYVSIKFDFVFLFISIENNTLIELLSVWKLHAHMHTFTRGRMKTREEKWVLEQQEIKYLEWPNLVIRNLRICLHNALCNPPQSPAASHDMSLMLFIEELCIEMIYSIENKNEAHTMLSTIMYTYTLYDTNS